MENTLTQGTFSWFDNCETTYWDYQQSLHSNSSRGSMQHIKQLEQFPKVFTGLGTLGGDYTIKLKEDTPVPFNKFPFGISSAPELFQRRMNSILEGLEGVVCLMDDVLVYGKDEAENEARLLRVLHLVGRDGVRADPEKTSAI